MEKEEKKVYQFKVLVETRTNTETNETKNIYNAITKKGKVKVFFTKDVKEEEKPIKTCLMTVLAENLNISEKYEFPTLWVSKIEKLEEIEFKNKLEEYLD